MDHLYPTSALTSTPIVPSATNLPSSVLPSDFLPRAKIFPVRQDTKRAALIGWQAAATADPAQHVAWAAQFPGCAWAIACAESGLIGVEIDPKARKVTKDKNSQQAGQERAEQAWRDMWTPRGAVAPWPPHTRSRSGGWHFYFKPPPGVDVKALRQGGLVKLPGWQQHVIETRVNGLLLIPPSEFEGRAYILPENGARAPYDAPPWLIEMMIRKTSTQPGEAPAPIVKPGSYNLHQLAKYICKVHHRVGMPRDVWMATIFALVAQYGRYVAWQIAQAIHDGEPDTSNQIDDLVGRASETFKPGDSTLNTLFKYARENSIHDVVPPLVSFGFAAAPLDIDQILKEIDMEELKIVEAPPTAPDTSVTAQGPAMPSPVPPPPPGNYPSPSVQPMPMMGGRGAKHVELWGPILAAVPHVERTAAHPTMPDTGHPLRDAINAAIPGIMATGNTEALAVIEVVHCHTAPLVGTITTDIKARAMALEQDAENRSDTMSDYHRNLKNNEPERDNVDNMKFFLRSLNIEIRFNEWIEREEIRGWLWGDWQPLDDTAVSQLRMRASQTGTRFLPGKEFTWDALLSMARNNRVDPARDLLDLLQSQWDGVPRLATWLTKACGVPDDAYHRAVSETILRGLCARIRQPGCKFDTMVVFISPRQGTSKSTLARVLALNSDWFAEDVSLGEVSKELVLLLAGKAVVEISEMRTRGEAANVKAMLSRTHDEARTAYSRKTTKRPRRNIFIGSTNESEFLEDTTGGRRFLPITVQGEIDLDFVRSNLAQLVGEAATQQAQGYDINLPREVWEIAGEHQEAARITSGVEELLRDWYETPETDVFVPSAEIVKRLADERQITTSTKAVAPIMRLIGYTRHKTEGPRLWVKSATEKYHAGCRHIGRTPLVLAPPPPAPAPREHAPAPFAQALVTIAAPPY